MVQGGVAWAMAPPVRYLSYTIDSMLLAAALLLVAILPSELFSNGWLAAKIVLLVIYIVLGTMALKRGRTRRVRGICFLLALATFIAIFWIARTHDPFAPFTVLSTLMP